MIKDSQLIACSSRGRCPNTANTATDLFNRIDELLKKADLAGFIETDVSSAIKTHQKFRISLAECPNACTQPQIKDIGIIGACMPQITDATCTHCNACVEACRENAVSLKPATAVPVITADLCLACGSCVKACASGTIKEGKQGWRVMLGGRLGRHPRLALELPGIFDQDQVMDIVKRCLACYKTAVTRGVRFADVYRGPESIGLPEKKCIKL